MNASKLAIRALTDLDTDSPRAMQLALLKFEEPEAKQFAKIFMGVWRKTSEGGTDNRSTKQALRDVKEFVGWIKQNQLNRGQEAPKKFE